MLRPFMRTKRSGMSLLEASAMASIVGTLLAVFVPTFARSLRLSKTAEATTNLTDLHQRTAAYFSARHGEAAGTRRWCLPDEAGPTPRFPSARRMEFDFGADNVPGSATWRAIGFQPGPVRFRYSLIPEAAGCGIRRPPHAAVVTFVAEADLRGRNPTSRRRHAGSRRS